MPSNPTHSMRKKGTVGRVNLTVDVDDGGADKQKSLKMVIGVMSDLGGRDAEREELVDRDFRAVDPLKIEELFDAYSPSVTLADGRSIDFRRMDDFRPEALTKKLFADLLALRSYLETLKKNTRSNEAREFVSQLFAKTLEVGQPVAAGDAGDAGGPPDSDGSGDPGGEA